MLNNLTHIATDAIGQGWYDSMIKGGNTLSNGGETLSYNPMNQLIEIGDNTVLLVSALLLIAILIGLVIAWSSSATSPNNADAKAEFADTIWMSVIKFALVILVLAGVFTAVASTILTNGGL